MDNLLYLLPVLACPIAMGAMMFVMMRPGRGGHHTEPPGGQHASEQELTQLRTEVDALRARLTDTDPASDTTSQARP